jgi:hypothetical protein
MELGRAVNEPRLLGCDEPCGVARPRKREWSAEKEKKGGRKRGGPVEVWAERPGRGAGPAAMPAQDEKEREAWLKERKRGRDEGLGFFKLFPNFANFTQTDGLDEVLPPHR